MSVNKICLKKKESQHKGKNIPMDNPTVEDCLNEENKPSLVEKKNNHISRSSSLSESTNYEN